MATIEIAKRAATRPTWAEVSLSALRENYRTVAEYVGDGVTVCAVVKADAYGHGAVECALALEQEGATWLGVTSLDEAIPLREEGIATRILLMTGKLGVFTLDEYEFTVDFFGLSYRLTQTGGEVISRDCRVAFCSARRLVAMAIG